jgi:hypothetical protein
MGLLFEDPCHQLQQLALDELGVGHGLVVVPRGDGKDGSIPAGRIWIAMPASVLLPFASTA